MKRINVTIIFLTVLMGNANAQSFKEQYTKCATILNGAGVGDTAYWRLIKRVYACMESAVAPEFTFKTVTGETLTRSQLKGQVVVINFWNTQCKPCVAEIPALNEMVALYKNRNVTFISATYESEQKANDFFKTHPFQFQNVADAERLITEDFLTNDVYPYSIIIDKKGKVKKIMIGGSFDKDDTFRQFVPAIDECLAKEN